MLVSDGLDVSGSRGESQTAVTERQAHLKLEKLESEKFATIVVISTKGVLIENVILFSVRTEFFFHCNTRFDVNPA